MAKQVCGVLYNGHSSVTLTPFPLHTSYYLYREKKQKSLLLSSSSLCCLEFCNFCRITSLFFINLIFLSIHLSTTFSFSTLASLLLAVCLCHSLLLSAAWLGLWYISLKRCFCFWVLLCPALFYSSVGHCQKKYATKKETHKEIMTVHIYLMMEKGQEITFDGNCFWVCFYILLNGILYSSLKCRNILHGCDQYC